MANQTVRPNQCGLRAGPLASSLKRARNLRNEEGGGTEVAGLASLEAEAEALAAMAASSEVEAAAEAVKAFKTSKKGVNNFNQCLLALCLLFY
jgi:hypothetical protein